MNSRNSPAAPFVINGAGLAGPLEFPESNISGPSFWELGVVVPDFFRFEIFDKNFLTSNDLSSIALEHGLVEPDTNSFLEIDSEVFGLLVGKGRRFLQISMKPLYPVRGNGAQNY